MSGDLDPATRARLEQALRPRGSRIITAVVRRADLSAGLAALDAAVAERDDAQRAIAEHWRPLVAALEAERDDLVQRVYRLLTHDGTAHGCCWDALTTAVQSVVERGARNAAAAVVQAEGKSGGCARDD